MCRATSDVVELLSKHTGLEVQPVLCAMHVLSNSASRAVRQIYAHFPLQELTLKVGHHVMFIDGPSPGYDPLAGIVAHIVPLTQSLTMLDVGLERNHFGTLRLSELDPLTNLRTLRLDRVDIDCTGASKTRIHANFILFPSSHLVLQFIVLLFSPVQVSNLIILALRPCHTVKPLPRTLAPYAGERRPTAAGHGPAARPPHEPVSCLWKG